MESLNSDNGIYGIMIKRSAFSDKEYESLSQSYIYSVKEKFLEEYQNHIAALQIISMCAKSFIMKNYKEVDDWSKLNVVIEDTQKKPTEYHNYIPDTVQRYHDGGILNKLLQQIEDEKAKKHNPIISIENFMLDTTDGDLSIKINGKLHRCIADDSVIVIANYIEDQLKQKNNN